MAAKGFEAWCEQYGLEFVRRLAEDGASDMEIASRTCLSLSTLRRWKKKHKELCRAIELGRQEADFSVVEAVYKRATGYNVMTNKTHKLKRVDYDPVSGKKLREYEELQLGVEEDHIPPDLRAGIFWLKNRQSERWSEKGITQEESFEGGVVELPRADKIDELPKDEPQLRGQ